MCRKYILSIFIFVATASCFNIDTNFPIVFVDPALSKNKDAKSYFGYSVVINPSSSTNAVEWIRIGAPKAINYLSAEDGVVYNCEIMNGCKEIKLPKSPVRNDESKIHGWVGGTMDISYEFDRMTVCAFHRYYLFSGDYRTFGACYLSTLNSTEFINMDPLLDFRRSTNTVHGKTFYLYGQGQVGFSAHFSDHRGDFVDLVLGAPGVYNWAGLPIRVRYQTIPNPPANRRRRSSIQDLSPIVDLPDTSRIYTDNVLFSYSVSSGYFIEDDRLLYAAGAPKANFETRSYVGKVVIFKFHESSAIVEIKSKYGEQFGEYFGASMASGKIDRDNLDDLVVGAPYFKDKSYNEGKVYVFLGGKDFLQKHMVLTGRSKNSQFGSVIMCLGDIDYDGYGDIAIGAPYEDDNTGAIYIYGGSDTGVHKNPRQVIFGKEIAPQLLGFGISISKAIDMDDNHYKDFAVGAYLSGHVVYLRSSPVVVVQYDFTALPSMLKLDSTSFVLSVCFSYSIYRESSLNITYNMSIVGRANILGQKNMLRNLSIAYRNTTCDATNVTLEASENLNSSIKAFFSYALNYEKAPKGITFIQSEAPEKNDMFCLRCPVLDVYRSNETYRELDIPFSRDCGDDNICQSDISIEVKFPSLGNHDTFVLGSRNNLEVEITLSNSGENAYGTELQIFLPEVTFRQKPTRCRYIFTNESAISCTIDDPLRKNAKKKLDLDLNLKPNLYKLLSVKELQLLFRVITTSENEKSSDRYGLKLRRKADVTLFGSSEQQTNFFGNSTTGTSDITHTYKIQRIGVSPLENVTVEIGIPYKYLTPRKEISFIELYEPTALLGTQSLTCQSGFSSYVSMEAPQIEAENMDITMRSKRQVEVFKNMTTRKMEDVKLNGEEIEVVPNKTFYLNTSSEDVIWSSVVCELDMAEEKLASIIIKMVFNASAVTDLMMNEEIISFSTHGLVKIDKLAETEKNAKRSIDVSTYFVNDKIEKVAVALWIIILAVIIGLLLLALLIFVLIKASFFKRAKRDELKDMKAAVSYFFY